MTPTRRMLEVGVEGDCFHLHAESPNCAEQGCVPVDVPTTDDEASQHLRTAAGSPRTLYPLILSAPFGNYFYWEGTSRTYGTFTAAARGGIVWRCWRVARTLRYSVPLRAWRNRLGLPNPGLSAFLDQARVRGLAETDIVSVHGFSRTEWQRLIGQVLQDTPCWVELNLSCPNVAHQAMLVHDALPSPWMDPLRLIAKLPPIDWLPMVEALYGAGIRWYHCCNTLGTPGGGLSGAVLKPYSLWAIRTLRERYGDTIRLIGGGGITSASDIAHYAEAGADRFAIGSVLLAPWRWQQVSRLQAAARASARWEGTTR